MNLALFAASVVTELLNELVSISRARIIVFLNSYLAILAVTVMMTALIVLTIAIVPVASFTVTNVPVTGLTSPPNGV